MKKNIERKQIHIIKMKTDLVFPSSLITGNGDKLLTQASAVNTSNSCTVSYSLVLEEDSDIKIEKGQHIFIVHSGAFKCCSCKKIVKKIFSGFCYVCLNKKASADWCILNPHLCHYAKGTCREPEWGKEFCFQPHYVYLSFTDKFKVGITRQTQLLTRWADQGATMGAVIAQVSSRHQAGVLEKALTSILSDKSHWQKMLKAGNNRPNDEEFNDKLNEVRVWLNLTIQEKNELTVQYPEMNLEKINIIANPSVINLKFPVPENVEKVKSVSLEKEKEISGEITGIKGQYLFLGERVFNMRNHEGYVVDINIF